MTAKLADQWAQHGLPVNKPEGVAQIIAGVAAERGMNGKVVYVEGDRGLEVEGEIDGCAGVWLGERQNGEFHRGNAIMEMVRLFGVWESDAVLTFGRVIVGKFRASIE